MFAIVQLGNRQFKVKAKDFIRVPYQNQAKGIPFQVPVLAFISDKNSYFDKENLKKSQVTAVLIRQTLSKKQLVFKKKRRKGYRKTQGHRQKMSELKILELRSPDGEISKVDFKPVKSKELASKKAVSKSLQKAPSGKAKPKGTKSDKMKSAKTHKATQTIKNKKSASPSTKTKKTAQTIKKTQTKAKPTNQTKKSDKPKQKSPVTPKNKKSSAKLSTEKKAKSTQKVTSKTQKPIKSRTKSSTKKGD